MELKTLLIVLPLITGIVSLSSQAMTVIHPRCELREAALGVDVSQPGLSWILQSDQRGDRQTAYHLLAASSPALLEQNQGDLWDTGKVASDATTRIVYSGKPLRSSQTVFWKVRVWDARDQRSPWSQPALWTMGVVAETDWQARWITAAADSPSLLLRRDFGIRPGLLRATVHASGLGHYELSINGRKVGEDLLAPGWTDYKKTCLYDSFDLTPLLRAGDNAAGLILGNGMYRIQPHKTRYVKFTQSFGPLQAIAQIRLDYVDGTTEIIGTGTDWKTAPSAITYNNLFAGEDYDARLELDGWDAPGFKPDARWTAAVTTSGPGGTLRGLSSAAPPIRAIDVKTPAVTHILRDNVTIYDLGQNASFMPRITVSGPAGSAVRIIPAELLKPDGTVDRASATQDGVRPAWWQYTLKGHGAETWFPKFFYQGCRYLQVELMPAEDGDGTLPKVAHLEGVVVHSSSTPVGEFTSSSELFNRIYSLVRWAQRSNMMSFMTDCPHREKLGWLEETHLNGPALRYNFDLAPLLQKSLNDMADSQLENGFVPNIAPEYFMAQPGIHQPFRNSPEWGGAIVMVPWQQYRFNGDTTLMRRHYAGMKRYVAFLASTAKDHIIPTGLGDWYDLGPKPPWGSQLTPPPLTATAFFQHYNWILARTAELLGNPDEARQFDEHAAQIRAAFNRTFFNPQTGHYATGSQCANSLAIVMNLVEPAHRDAVLAAIIADVRSHGDALTTGDVGYRYLLRALADNGRSDVILAMNNQSEKPGYGYQLKKGATSLTEKWDAGVGSFGSQNHFMLGQINEWFFHDLAGIQPDPAGPGFKKIIIKPAILRDLAHVRSSYDSTFGKIISAWQRTNRQLNLDVVIPPNTTATVYMPTREVARILEGTSPASRAPGVKYLRTEDGAAVFEVGSGSYRFTSDLN